MLVPPQLRHAPALAHGDHCGRGSLRALPVRHRRPAAVYLLPVLGGDASERRKRTILHII